MSKLATALCACLMLSYSAFAEVSPLMFTCKSENMTLSLHKKLSLRTSGKNGWKDFLGKVDYELNINGSVKKGSLEASIHWRNDPRPGYNTLFISLLSVDDAERLREGIEGGSEGFGALDIRDKVQNKFSAKWSLYRNWPEINEFNTYSDELVCQVQ